VGWHYIAPEGPHAERLRRDGRLQDEFLNETFASPPQARLALEDRRRNYNNVHSRIGSATPRSLSWTLFV
jgi:hypothetical protein